MRADNAVIMAAGTSSRFAPISYENHKAMTVVKGEVLIERQIRQLKDTDINDIFIVTGYKAYQFDYLISKYGVELIHNPDYLIRNNNSSIWAARNVLNNSYVCSSDNYFTDNPFEKEPEESYYAAEYADGHTEEWCMTENSEGYINSVTIGGKNAWYMLGHTFWSREFSKCFLNILEAEYYLPETYGKLWESIFMSHLDVLKMKIRKYRPGVIYEFDSLDELRAFDKSYLNNSRSALMKKVAAELGISESEMIDIGPVRSTTAAAAGFEFNCPYGQFKYYYESGELIEA